MPGLPTKLKIGAVEVAPATVLAPMAGVTDTMFRRFIRQLGGCGLLMTEFTSSHGVIARNPRRTMKYLAFDPDEHPISAQLFGADPEVMAKAARICQELGFDVVDINFGCPVNKVVRTNGGSALLRDLPLVERLLRGVRAAITIPLTVKCRAGWSEREIVALELARMAEDCGVDVQMIKTGIIHFLFFAHVIFDCDLYSQEPTSIIPDISAVVPSITCDHTSIEPRIERLLMTPRFLLKDGIITTKIRTVCNESASAVKYPCLLTFFLLSLPLTDGRPIISKNKMTIWRERTVLPRGSSGTAIPLNG